MNVVYNDGNLSAIAGYVLSGSYLYYNITAYNITPQLPCIKYKQGTINGSSIIGGTNCSWNERLNYYVIIIIFFEN